MSFSNFKLYIEEGDTVILYINPHNMHAIEVKSIVLNKNGEEVENVFQTTFGALKVQSLIGKKYGIKVTLSKGWAHVLYPTSELWTLTLPHRTQIIYTPDISMILFELELKPGSVVIEAGTGSGSLTHSLARTVYPDGYVYSFDFHENRVLVAEKEFANHGITNVSIKQRDVCTEGYGEEIEYIADAVFLDLPLPWKAVIHAMKCIKKTGGRLASFSPCIEQVQKTCTCLQANGFIEINTVESLQREFTVVQRTLPLLSLNSKSAAEQGSQSEKFFASLPPQTMPGHTGYLTFATLPPLNFRLKPKHSELSTNNNDSLSDVAEITSSST